MNDRKLRKLLKENAIDSRSARHTSGRRWLRRLTQVAACLLVVCLLGVGYVTMIRFVGMPGDPQDSSPEPGMVSGDGSGTTLPPSDSVTTKHDLLEGDEMSELDTSTDLATEAVSTSGEVTTTVEKPPLPPTALSIYAVDTADRLEWGAEDITGNSMLDMAVERRLALGEFGAVEVNYYATAAQLTETVLRDVAAGEAANSLVTAPAESIMKLTTSGALNDLAKMESIELVDKREYWNGCMADSLMLGSSLYFVSGRLSMGTMLSSGVLLADTAQLSLTAKQLCTLVIEGKWTLDRMLSLAREADGIGLSLDGDDGLQQLVNGAGLRLVTNTLSRSEVWNDGSLEALVLAVNGLSDKLSTGAAAGAPFTVTTLGGCAERTTSSVILPLPAATEAEAAQGYCAPIAEGAVYYAIPHQRDADSMAVVLRQLAVEHSFDLDGALTMRYALSDAEAEVLELVLDGMSMGLDGVISQAEQPLLRGLAGIGSSSSAMLKNLCKINDKLLAEYTRAVG